VGSAVDQRPIHPRDGTSDGTAVGRWRSATDGFANWFVRSNSRRTIVVGGGRPGLFRHYLQNRWSASLAMSTDGSFPSRPRQFRIWGVTAEAIVGHLRQSVRHRIGGSDGTTDGTTPPSLMPKAFSGGLQLLVSGFVSGALRLVDSRLMDPLVVRRR
jgi:hypothetical protein